LLHFSGLHSGQGTGYCEQEDLNALWALSERLSGFTYKRRSAWQSPACRIDVRLCVCVCVWVCVCVCVDQETGPIQRISKTAPNGYFLRKTISEIFLRKNETFVSES
jgi:hypothetical protein